MKQIIELDFDQIRTFENCCTCCNNVGYSKSGVIVVNGHEFGLYHSSWVDGPKHNEVSLVITSGNIEKTGDFSKNVSFYMKVRVTNGESEFMVKDGIDMPFSASIFFGKLLTRNDALKHPLADLYFKIGDQIVNEDEDVNGYLGKTIGRG